MDTEHSQPDGSEPVASDIRLAVGRVLLDRMDVIISDSVAIFPFSGPQPLDAEYCERLGQLLLQILSMAVRDGRLDARVGFVSDLQRLAAERALTAERLFTFVYLTERTTLDELALHDSLGATSEPWPLVAQLIRRASFDLLAAYTERIQQEPTGAALIDRLTTLYSRAFMDAVLSTEVQRAERFGSPIALIVFDVDHLSDINGANGYGVGDRLLERLGILIRKYFRQQDWVFRHGEDSIAVLLCQIGTEDAGALAERVLGMVEERLGFKDYRTDRRVRVTVSAAVVTAQGAPGESFDAERVLIEADAALDRAKSAGRNRVECAVIVPAALSVAVAARYLQCSPTTVRKLITDGTLHASGTGRDLRVDRLAVEDYRRAKTQELKTKSDEARAKK